MAIEKADAGKETTAEPKSKMSLGKKIGIGFAVVVLVNVVASLTVSKDNKPANGDEKAVAVSAAAKAPLSESGWQYGESKDKMRGTVTSYAYVYSLNTLNFKFPYSGGSIAELIIFKDPKYGYLARLQVDKGQFLQRQMFFKFDDNPVMDSNKLGDLSVYDNGETNKVTIAIGHGKQLVELIKKSKHLTIEAQFYDEGSRQMEFPIENFNLN